MIGRNGRDSGSGYGLHQTLIGHRILIQALIGLLHMYISHSLATLHKVEKVRASQIKRTRRGTSGFIFVSIVATFFLAEPS